MVKIHTYEGWWDSPRRGRVHRSRLIDPRNSLDRVTTLDRRARIAPRHPGGSCFDVILRLVEVEERS
jgi:hypothetical protein